MLFNFKTVASILAALSLVKGDDASAIASEDSAVVKLTQETFETFIKENPLVLAEFFAPWCGHCKNLGPEFSAAADKLVDKDVKLAQIDCTEERDLCSQFEIRGYPTMKIFKSNAAEPSDYQGQRSSDAIVNYMVKLTQPAVSVVEDADDLNNTIAELTSDALILQIIPEDLKVVPSNETFYEIASSLREDYNFYSTSNKDFVEKYSKSSKTPTYVLFRPNESIDNASVYEGKELDDTHLIEFLNVESKPLFGEMSGETYQAYTSSELPLAYYFYNSIEEKDAAADIINKLAKKYRGEINFVGLDAVQYGMHAQNLNMNEEFPLFVIHDLVLNKKYGISQEKPLDNNEITNFVKKFKAGKIEPIVKSEPIPETQNSSVYHLVGNEHDAIVKSDKDVLVKYYAPWCGHCKKLAPIFEELADLYKDNEKVVVAELDHTLNDIEGVDIQGYPTLVLFPADGSDPIYFDKQRSLEAMADFIKESGSNKVDGLESKSVEEEETETDEKVLPEAEVEIEIEEEPIHDEL